MRIRTYAALPVLTCALLLSGCAGQTSPAGTSVETTATTGTTATTATTAAGTPSARTPTLPTSPDTPPPPGDPTDPPLPSGRSRPVTATGPVRVSDVEQSCIVMTISGRTYQLVGPGVDTLHDGDTVKVTGYADGARSTGCQVGAVLVVTALASVG